MRTIIFLMIAFCLSGCLSGTRSFDLPVPNYTAEKTVDIEVYLASVNDVRVFEEKPKKPSIPSTEKGLRATPKSVRSTLIGRQRDGFGKAVGGVGLSGGLTVEQKMRELITKGLEERGYMIVESSNSSAQVNVDIEKFWAWPTPGFPGMSYHSNIECKVTINTASGKHELLVKGGAKKPAQFGVAANWIAVYNEVMLDFLQNLDKALTEKGL